MDYNCHMESTENLRNWIQDHGTLMGTVGIRSVGYATVMTKVVRVVEEAARLMEEPDVDGFVAGVIDAINWDQLFLSLNMAAIERPGDLSRWATGLQIVVNGIPRNHERTRLCRLIVNAFCLDDDEDHFEVMSEITRKGLGSEWENYEWLRLLVGSFHDEAARRLGRDVMLLDAEL